MPGKDANFRPCLKILEAEQRQCREPAVWVCCDASNLQWYACEIHAADHDFVRIPLSKFLSLIHARTAIPLSAWEASPRAAGAVKHALEAHHGT